MKTKIICSIGPASESDKIIKELIFHGMDIARLNLSHDKLRIHEKRIEKIRKYSKLLNKKVEILCDLQGPKIRLGESADLPRKISTDSKIVLSTSSCSSIEKGEIPIEDPYLHSDLTKGDIILIDDGQIELLVLKTIQHKIHARVIRGGMLYHKKGVNVPATTTTTNSLTEKDKNDLEVVLKKNPEWIGLSFVQSKEDISLLKNLIGKNRSKIMCKIERASALKNLENIIKNSDAIMVARGDLGVEIPFEKVPIIQKQIINRCNKAKKFVATATHMLASMTEAPFPTRAEVSDIANAIFDGTNAVMLSNETTVGKYPVQALKTMVKIVKTTENYLRDHTNLI